MLMQDHLTVLPCRVTQQKMIVKTAKRQASHCYLLMLLRSGWLYDISNSYDNSFYMMGVCIVVSGAMLYPIPCIQRWRFSHHSRKPAVGGEPEVREEQVALNEIAA